MMISLAIPVVSGSCRIRTGSVPAMQAAAESNIAAHDPQVTYPASAPVISAILSPTLALSSSMTT